MTDLIATLEGLARKPKTRTNPSHYATRPAWSLNEQNWLHDALPNIIALLKAKEAADGR